ncbi:Hypothetical predicted protein [Lecanosticta acicola]|uniref:Uncharacterized protein n=1 Tax=Lecanosticta acicola TaxID=111012 RepID=A0AAI9EC02_9PEZI|nr:Hypothetical predicted protein [Lecanosticta acicola]
MASSKFWTWTKGSNMSRPSGEFARDSPNLKRKPLPLDFDAGPDEKPNRKTSSRTNDSIALQEAAVQSATSLLAVMNDCLNTHLLSTSQQQPNGLQPTQGRPRSRTAPSTPMAEAPAMEPVELPASPSPTRKYQKHRFKHSVDSKLARNVSSSNTEYLDRDIDRPHSSPQETHHKLPVPPKTPHESFYRCGTSYPPAYLAPPPHFGSPRNRAFLPSNSAFHLSDETLVNPEAESATKCGKRPSLGTSPNWQRNTSSARGTSQDHGALAVPKISTPVDSARNISIPREVPSPADLEDVLIAQTAAMRASHEAHVASLKETHEREVASYRAYISLLENQRMANTARPDPQNATARERQHLTIDTCQPRHNGLLSSCVSASTSLQSFELSLENQKRKSLEAAAEVESLKRKLELSRKAQADLGDVRRERDQLREATDKSDRRIAQLKDLVRKAKEKERAAKNAAAALEAALESANNERLDVLEGFHEACTQIRKLRQRERELIKEQNEINNRYGMTEANIKRVRPLGRESTKIDYQELERRRNTLRHDPLLQQLDELRQMVAEKAAKILELENANELSTGSQQDPKVQLERTRQELIATQQDRDRYNSLLHSELRRQSRIAGQKLNLTTPQIEAEASKALSQRLRADSAHATAKEATDREAQSEMTKIEILEQELQHCMQEIILYKLDIKGYKKDVKKATAEVEALRTQTQRNAPIVPDKDAYEVSIPPGLGIHWPPPRTPCTPNRPFASSAATLTPQPPPTSTVSSPPQRKTPLSTHKKLPKPPVSASPPHPSATQASPPLPGIQRQETLRSLSESIISSYAKRSTPEQTNVFQTSSWRGRSSDPPKHISAFVMGAPVPISVPKHEAEMLRTPVRSAAAAACFT